MDILNRTATPPGLPRIFPIARSSPMIRLRNEWTGEFYRQLDKARFYKYPEAQPAVV